MNLLIWICVALFVLWCIAMFAAFMGGSSNDTTDRRGGGGFIDWLL